MKQPRVRSTPRGRVTKPSGKKKGKAVIRGTVEYLPSFFEWEVHLQVGRFYLSGWQSYRHERDARSAMRRLLSDLGVET